MIIDIGLSKKDRKLLADSLCRILSDSCLLLQKTQGFRWNIKGEQAYSFQLMFKNFEEELHNAIEKLAKRIRALGFFVPVSYSEHLCLGALKEDHTNLHEAPDILRRLVFDNELLVRRAREIYELSEPFDPVTSNIMRERMQIHAENAWILRSHLE